VAISLKAEKEWWGNRKTKSPPLILNPSPPRVEGKKRQDKRGDPETSSG